MSAIQKGPYLAAAAAGGLMAAAGYFAYPWLHPSGPPPQAESAGKSPEIPPQEEVRAKVFLSDLAIANLGLKAKQLKPQDFWKTIATPGMVVDRPGWSDRGVPSPTTGVIAQIHHVAGDAVRPGEVLFTLHLLSESLHLTQSELFKTTQDVKLAEAQARRLAASAGAIPESRQIEVQNQIARLHVAQRAYRQELLNRGLSAAQLERVAEGDFVKEIPIVAPLRPASEASEGHAAAAYEVQELKVELGQQVQAGQTLCLLSDHQALAIEGRAFRDETALLEQSVRNGWPVTVDFQEDPAADWPPTAREFPIRYIANTIDPATRTFAFSTPLENQSRKVERDGRTQILWRFRPGQRVRIEVRGEKLEKVFVLPAEAVARDAAERYVFTQNVNTFERRAVRVLHHDRRVAVLADDGAVPAGMFVVQSGAAALDRMARAPAAGAPAGFHVHADGSLHQNSDEGK